MDVAELSPRLEDAAVVEVSARRVVSSPPQTVYTLLSDLRRHWPLLGAELIEARIVDNEERSGAVLLVGGPIPGIRREIVTRITVARPDQHFGGEAVAGQTVAAILWRLTRADSGGCAVELSATIAPGGWRDRLLVAAARPWLTRRCAAVLEQLERELVAD